MLFVNRTKSKIALIETALTGESLYTILSSENLELDIFDDLALTLLIESNCTNFEQHASQGLTVESRLFYANSLITFITHFKELPTEK